MRKILILAAMALVSSTTLAQDVPVKCTFDGKVVEGSCPKDKAPLCDTKDKVIKCTDNPYIDKKRKDKR